MEKLDVSSFTPKNERIKIPKIIDIGDIMLAKHLRTYVQTRGTLIEKGVGSYIAQVTIDRSCTPTDCNMCTGCKHLDNPNGMIELDVYNSEILSSIDASVRELKNIYNEVSGAPEKCKKIKFSNYGDHINLYRANIVPCVTYEAGNDEEDEMEDASYSINISTVLMGDLDIKENRDYDFFGVTHQHPKTNELTFLVDKIVPVADDISHFELNPARIRLMQKFQSEHTVEAVNAKMEAILKEKRVNHHKIFGYPRMEYLVDITFHSVTAFMFKKNPHYRGWLDGAIIGDSRTGKSEIVKQTIKLHKMGHRVSCDNITFAGVVGGMDQSSHRGGKHTLRWGLLPRMDRRLVAFDEAHNKDAVKIWQKLNDVRSSGTASISKIGAPDRSIKSRNRKLFIANPPDGTVRDYHYPVEMVQGIFTAPETIARLDFLTIPRTDDSTHVPGEEDEIIPDYYFAGDGYTLLMNYIYSRRIEQVIFTKEAEAYLVKMGADMSALCDNINIPLLQANEARFTLARGAAAQAARLWSVDETMEKIVVQKCHAEAWVNQLRGNYEQDSNRYFDYSEMVVNKLKFKNFDEFYTNCALIKEAVKSDSGLLTRFIESNEMSFKHIGDSCNLETAESRKLFSILTNNSLIKAKGVNSTFKKTRRGTAVFKFLVETKSWDHVDKDQCKEFFERETI